MSTLNRKIFVMALLLAPMMLLHSPAAASGPGTASGAFLKIPRGARASGLGESFTAVSADADSVFFNPAGLASMPRRAISFSYLLWIEDTKYGNFSFVYPGVLSGNLAIGVSALAVPATVTTLEDSSGAYAGEGGSFSAGYHSIAAAYSRAIKKNIDAGMTLKLLRENLDQYSGTAFAADFGILSKNVYPELDLAIAVKNIGTPMKVHNHSAPLPACVNAGLAYRLREKTLMLADFVYYNDSGFGINAGAEYKVHEALSIRGGYTYNETVSEDLFRGLRLGWGLSRDSFVFDYAYIPTGLFGASHTFAFKRSF